jgi:hypothetical protein
MLQAVEGIYKNGTIKLSEAPQGIAESRVIVTFLATESTAHNSQIMRFGMFHGSNRSTEEDFHSAEFKGDSDDGLDWS